MGGSCPGQFNLHPTHLNIKVNYFANSTYFKLSESVDVSIMNMIQVKFSCVFFCQFVSYAKLHLF